jgi:N-acetyl-1-D-myo-inositol-2-amino-2-deoxy-alpha-D-glucopyranoside deacetylase
VSELTLVCVHPHPDDEAISCGGVLARSADEGIRTHVVTCTGGEAGDNLAGIDLGDRDLPSARREEMAAAAAALGLSGHTWLGFRDSGMAGTPANEHPEAFVRVDLDAAAARLARIIRDLRPQVVVSDDENGTYGHPDHIQAHRVTTRAVTLAADPGWETGQAPWQVAKRYVHTLSRTRVWRFHVFLREHGLTSPFGDAMGPDDLPFGVPDGHVTTTVDVGPWLDRKEAAMRAHASQIAPDSYFLNVPDDLAEAGFGVEQFVLVGADPAVVQETDLFTGLR